MGRRATGRRAGRRATGRRAGRRGQARRSAARRATLAGLALLAGLAIAVAWSSAATARPGAPDGPPSADQPRDCDPAPICPPDREPVPQDRPSDPGPVSTGEEAHCLKRIGDMADSHWQLMFSQAQMQAWTMEYMGLSPPGGPDSVWNRLLRGIGGTLSAGPNGGISAFMTDLTETVPIRLPWYVHQASARWYIEEAKEEAENHRNCALARHVPTGSCAEIRAGGESVTRRDIVGILPDQCWGNYPSSSFDLHYDNLGFLDHKLWALATGLAHAIGKGAIQVTLALIGWAFVTFEMEDYSPIAVVAGGRYHTELIQRFDQVTQLAWIVLFGFSGAKALRGKLGLAGGEIVMSIVAVSLATFMMANREGYLDGAADTIDKASTTLLAAGSQGEEPISATGEDTSYTRAQVIEPLQKTLHEEFVELPFDHIHFGTGDLPDECQRRRNAILWAGVHRDGGWGQRYMRGGHGTVPADDESGAPARPASERADCNAFADNMGRPTETRFLTALITAVVCCMVAAILGTCALTVMISKMVMMFVFIILPFGLVATILPGAGRRLAWSMAGTGVQAGAAEIGMSFVLSFLLVTLDGVHRLLRQMGLFERWLVVGLLLLIVFWVRMRWLGATKSMATNITNALTRASPASRNHAGGEEGINLAHTDRTAGRGLVGATYGGILAAGTAAAIGYGVVKGAGRGLVVPQLHRRRDLRNKRYAAENLRDNRNNLWRYEQRPKRQLVREVDLASSGTTALSTSSTPKTPAGLIVPSTPRRNNTRNPNLQGGNFNTPPSMIEGAPRPIHPVPAPAPGPGRRRLRVPFRRARDPRLDRPNYGLPTPVHPPPGRATKLVITQESPIPRTPFEQLLGDANQATFEGRRGDHYGELVGLDGPAKDRVKKNRGHRLQIRRRGW
jgi:hypothetical protein